MVRAGSFLVEEDVIHQLALVLPNVWNWVIWDPQSRHNGAAKCPSQFCSCKVQREADEFPNWPYIYFYWIVT